MIERVFDLNDMAAWAELKKRIEGLQAAGLDVETTYRSKPLPNYLQDDATALVVNVKGVPVDELPVLVPLSVLEKLLGQ